MIDSGQSFCQIWKSTRRQCCNLSFTVLQRLTLMRMLFSFCLAKFCLVFPNRKISWNHVLGVSGVHLALLSLIFQLDTQLIWFVLQKPFDLHPFFPTEFIEKNYCLNSSGFYNPLTKTSSMFQHEYSKLMVLVKTVTMLHNTS